MEGNKLVMWKWTHHLAGWQVMLTRTLELLDNPIVRWWRTYGN